MSDKSKPAVFVREATGLVRELSAMDVALFNFAILGFLFTLYFALALMPEIGGNYLLAILITAILSTFTVYTYYAFHLAMPRSGGDYVFISRTLLPSLGFVSNASFVLILLIYNGITGVTIQSTGISIGLAALGSVFQNSTLAALSAVVIQPTWLLILGTLEIVLLAIPAVFGRKAYFTLQNVIYIIVFVVTLAMIGLLASNSNEAFRAAFNSYSAHYTNSTDYYNGVIALAQKNGWSAPDRNSLYNTILLVPILEIFGVSFWSSTYLGAEIKNPSKNSLIGMLGAMYAAFALTAVFITVAYNTIGFNFFSALDSQLYTGTLPLPVLPYVNFLVLLLSNNPLITVVIVLAGIIQMAIYTPAFYYLGSRSLLAYSFDRVLPKTFARVSERFHAPVISIIILVVLSEVSLILLNIPYTAAAIYQFSTVLTWYGAIFPTMIVGFAGILFPYLKRDMFESSPAKKRVGGVPLISLTGIGTVFFSALVVYLELTNPVYAANSAPAIYTVIGFVVVLFAIYFAAKVVRKREGLPLELAFKQLPPE